MQSMARNVGHGGADDALLLPETDGIFGRIAVVTRFDFDEAQRRPIVSDNIDFGVDHDIAPIAADRKAEICGHHAISESR